MKTWDADLGQYIDGDMDQGDDKSEADEPDAKLKIKLKGKAALDVIKAITPSLRKTKPKKTGQDS
jgi:hypothetical protein